MWDLFVLFVYPKWACKASPCNNYVCIDHIQAFPGARQHQKALGYLIHIGNGLEDALLDGFICGLRWFPVIECLCACVELTLCGSVRGLIRQVWISHEIRGGCVCVFVWVCMYDSEYFMVEERVNSDRRQMWSHPWKVEDKNKWLGQDLGIRAKLVISQHNINPTFH